MIKSDFLSELKKVNFNDIKSVEDFYKLILKNKNYIYEMTFNDNLIGILINEKNTYFINKIKKNFKTEYELAIKNLFFENIPYCLENEIYKNPLSVYEVFKEINELELFDKILRNKHFIGNIVLYPEVLMFFESGNFISLKEILNENNQQCENFFYMLNNNFDFLSESKNLVMVYDMIKKNSSIENKKNNIFNFFQVMVKIPLSESVLKDLCELVKITVKERIFNQQDHLSFLFSIIINDKVSEKSIYECIKKDIEELKENSIKEYTNYLLKMIDSSNYYLLLKEIEKDPKIINYYSVENENKLYKLFFTNNLLKITNHEYEEDFFYKLVQNKNYKEYYLKIVNYILSEIKYFDNEDYENMLCNYTNLKNMESFKLVYNKIKEEEIKISKTTYIKCLSKTPNNEVINFLLKDPEVKKNYFPYIVLNSNFWKYVKENDLSENEKTFLFSIYLKNQPKKEIDTSVESLFNIMDNLNNINIDYLNKLGENFLDVFINNLKDIKSSDYYIHNEELFFDFLSNYYNMKDIVSKIESSLIVKMESISILKFEKLNTLNTLIEVLDEEVLKPYLLNNLDTIIKSDSLFTILKNGEINKPIMYTEINSKLLKKSIENKDVLVSPKKRL